jgi:hypothetical protein
VYNLRWHFETKQISTGNILENSENKIDLQFREWKSNKIFLKSSDSSEQGIEVTFEISHLIVKSLRPYIEGDCKEPFNCCVTVALLHNIQSSQFEPNDSTEAAGWCYESVDITSVAQMCIFARDATSVLKCFEELVDLHSMQGWRRGLDFIQPLLCSFHKHSLELPKLVGFMTDGSEVVCCVSLTGIFTS